MRDFGRRLTAFAIVVFTCAMTEPVTAQRSEREMNAEGYRLLGEHRVAEAVAVFRSTLATFPASANAWDSLGDGLATAGERIRAAEAFAEAFRRDTTNTRARDLAVRLRNPRRARWTHIRNDDSVTVDTVQVRSGSDDIRAYVARPSRPGRYPAVILLHANRITEPYIASTVQMLARAGFAAMALDVFHFLPGNASWESASQVPGDTVSAVIVREFSETRLLRNLQSGIDYLHARTFVAPGGVALMGFCGGGWNALIASAQLRDVGAVVAFYAPPAIVDDPQHRAPIEVASFITVPVQYHFATHDRYVPKADADRFLNVLQQQHTQVERFDYDAEHGFFAWNRQGIFAEAEADLAWSRVVPFLTAHTAKTVRARRLAPAPPRATSRRAPQAQHAVLHSVPSHQH